MESCTLKPSLVEWKLDQYRFFAHREDPLKPSLVEWKPAPNEGPCLCPSPLETFLSGMETSPSEDIPPLFSLSLKPSLVEWKHATRQRLSCHTLP